MAVGPRSGSALQGVLGQGLSQGAPRSGSVPWGVLGQGLSRGGS